VYEQGSGTEERGGGKEVLPALRQRVEKGSRAVGPNRTLQRGSKGKKKVFSPSFRGGPEEGKIGPVYHALGKSQEGGKKRGNELTRFGGGCSPTR